MGRDLAHLQTPLFPWSSSSTNALLARLPTRFRENMPTAGCMCEGAWVGIGGGGIIVYCG